MPYEVKTDGFEGPLELLLELIEAQKLSINEISLAVIADQYITRVRGMQHFHTEEVAAFLVVAATLMLIKSRSLLPQLELSQEDETDIRDLEERLKAYRRMRELSHHIQVLEKRGIRLYERPPYADVPNLFYPPSDLSLRTLAEYMRRIIETLPKKEVLPEKIVSVIVSLEEKMQDLVNKVERGLAKSFDSFTRGTNEKIDIIVSFLAVLELIKQGLIHADQSEMGSDIAIQSSHAHG